TRRPFLPSNSTGLVRRHVSVPARWFSNVIQLEFAMAGNTSYELMLIILRQEVHQSASLGAEVCDATEAVLEIKKADVVVQHVEAESIPCGLTNLLEVQRGDVAAARVRRDRWNWNGHAVRYEAEMLADMALFGLGK